MDALEQRVNSHDQANRNLLEQIMKLQQDIKVSKACYTFIVHIVVLYRLEGAAVYQLGNTSFRPITGLDDVFFQGKGMGYK